MTTTRAQSRVFDDVYLHEQPAVSPKGGAQHWLSLPELTEDEAKHGVLVTLRRDGGDTVAQALVTRASHINLLMRAGFSAAALESCAFISNVQVSEEDPSLRDALLYCAGRRGRILGASTLLSALNDLDGKEARGVGMSRVPRAAPTGYVFGAQRMDLWMHRTFLAMQAAGKKVDTQLFGDEVAETIRAWVKGAPEWTFFRMVRERRLAREQYVYAMANLYQFVRHTTRLIGRAISHSVDTDLRRHWIGHMNGEVNHEVIIERDLAHMGEDVEFMMHHMPPCSRAQEFMAIQESMIAYYEDPVLFMASPLAAEAITAHLDQRLIDDLQHCAARWGVKDPARATKFLSSHISTDGGEDGHWKMSIDALPRLISTEARLALFLTTNASSRRAIEGVWSQCIADTAIWTEG